MIQITKRNRILKKEEDLFNHNAWDDTEWTEEMLQDAEKRVLEQREASHLQEDEINQVESEVTNKWDEFYEAHGDKFFKDRRWIFSEFPEIMPKLEQAGSCNIFEVGCGVGNAVAYMIKSNRNQNLNIYCCDLSRNAIDALKRRDFYKSDYDKIHPICANILTDFESSISKLIAQNSIDFITLIFTMSALKPGFHKVTVDRLSRLLKPGGLILFRDYARYDMTQLRFKGKSYIRDNYYLRADGTTSYFFTKEIVHDIFDSANLEQIELKQDNRILVNRQRALKMCRCWIQAKYQKKK